MKMRSKDCYKWLDKPLMLIPLLCSITQTISCYIFQHLSKDDLDLVSLFEENIKLDLQEVLTQETIFYLFVFGFLLTTCFLCLLLILKAQACTSIVLMNVYFGRVIKVQKLNFYPNLQIQHHFAAEDFSLSWLPTITDNYQKAKLKVHIVPHARFDDFN
jgi:hypothetical protein